jgi:geranylgeranyl diphosphate synthase type I
MQSTGDLALLDTVQQGSPEVTVRVSQLLTENYLEMIEGQCLDLDFEAKTGITTNEYLEMIARKTGALIRSGLEIGALVATDDADVFRAFSHFGGYLGRAFQIRDDFLGIWGNVSNTGKVTGNDIRRRKKSFPVVFALNHAEGQSRDDLLEIYSRQVLDEDDVARVLSALDEVGAQEHSQRVIEASARDALNALQEISLPLWAREEAEGLVDYLAHREY